MEVLTFQDNHQVDPHLYPTRACWLRAVQLVRSLADNVPNWVHDWPQENPSGSSIRLRARVGQYGEISQRTAHASSIAARPTGVNRSEACFLVFACVARLQVSQVPARDRRAAGVEAPPKLSVKAITWNVERPSVRHVRFMASQP